ncbi:hypothetical protein DPIF8902391_20008 [Tenacibaculum maritimum]|nr:hypothetical protein DPIF8902391_20008 [Tenacibaculum maritimum]
MLNRSYYLKKAASENFGQNNRWNERTYFRGLAMHILNIECFIFNSKQF